MLLVDLGNFVAGKKGGYGFDNPITMGALRRMGYDVLAIGEGEVMLGLDTVDSLLGAYDLRGVSNNILDAANGSPRYEPYAVLKTGHLKVGVTSMIPAQAKSARALEDQQGIEIADGIGRSREVLKALRKEKVDVAILLARATPAQAQQLADSLAGYDVILAGARRTQRREPEKRGKTVLGAMDGGCSWLGELNLSIEKRRIVAFGGTFFEMNQDDGPVDQYLKDLTYAKLELDEKGERIQKRPPEEQQSRD